MIHTIAAIVTVCFFLFSALLVVCRGFAMQEQTREPYEARLWVKYSRAVPAEGKRAA